MSKLNQKEAAFNAITKVLAEAGIDFEAGTTVVKPLMTKEMRAQVNQILFEGFRAGTIEIDAEKSDKDLKQYVSGLQSNWLNKDDRLTAGTKYVAKNPGSRTGTTDPQVKALRALLSKATDESEKEEIQGYLDARLEAIGQTKKAKTIEVNFDDLPAELRAKYEIVETHEEA